MNDKNNKMNDQDLKQRLEKYLKKAEPLFKNLKINYNSGINKEKIEKFYEMTIAYYNDAKFFYEKGRFIESLAALEYAEGWMDAGKLIGIFE